MERIKKGDMVQVISGNEMGERGEVKEMLYGWDIIKGEKHRNPGKDRVVVAQVNIRKKHQRRVSQTRQAGIIDMEAPLHTSNVMLVCPNCDQASRIGYRYENEHKVRWCKRCNTSID